MEEREAKRRELEGVRGGKVNNMKYETTIYKLWYDSLKIKCYQGRKTLPSSASSENKWSPKYPVNILGQSLLVQSSFRQLCIWPKFNLQFLSGEYSWPIVIRFFVKFQSTFQ